MDIDGLEELRLLVENYLSQVGFGEGSDSLHFKELLLSEFRGGIVDFHLLFIIVDGKIKLIEC